MVLYASYFFIFTFLSWFPVILLAQYQHVYKEEKDQVPRTVFIDLSQHLNNRGASGPDSNFDGTGQYFECSLLTPPPSHNHSDYINNNPSRNNNEHITRIHGLPFALSLKSSYDNIMCQSQFISLQQLKNSNSIHQKKTYGALYLLAAVNHGPITTDITIVYQDGTQTATTLNLPDWQFRYSEQQIRRIDTVSCVVNGGKAKASLFVIPVLTDPSKQASYMMLPSNGPLGSFQPALHIFAMTGIIAEPAATTTMITRMDTMMTVFRKQSIDDELISKQQQQKQLYLNVISVKGTRRWYDKHTFSSIMQQQQKKIYKQKQRLLKSNKKMPVSLSAATVAAANDEEYPIVVVKIHNTGLEWIKDASVFLKGPFVKTQYHGCIHRLAPGHVMEVDVAVKNLLVTDHEKGGRISTSLTVTVVDVYGNSLLDEPLKGITFDSVEVGVEEYEETERSLKEHAVPSWFEQAKFGIFIHWGVYSIPSWAPVGRDYAEWYWWNYNQKDSPTYHYHRSFYGPDVEYDDFIALWKPNQYDSNDWLDLIDASGATYFVFTTKHHDGIALFDTKVTDRSTVKINPYRDFVRELITVADTEYPWLKKGLYFSLPEWYHPSYNDDSIHWHGPPRNPYIEKEVPYHGASTVPDFVNDVQVPQILEIIDLFDPDIMWCDIGGINNSTAWQAKFLNQARQKGKQVVMNDRCGNSISDFETVEYSERNYVPAKFWESTRGVDPHSFGFNHQTSADQYASTKALLQELVSVICKGGNFLLNIGPEMSGRIPPIMRHRLLEMGEWIERVEESLFQTLPYWVASMDFHEPGQSLYFTQAIDGSAIYVFLFEAPLGKRVIIKTKVPLHEETRITLLSSKRFSHEALQWQVISTGRLIIQLPEHMVDSSELLWVFKIETP